MTTRDENRKALEVDDPALAEALKQKDAGRGVYSPAVVEFQRAADLLEELAAQCENNGMRDWSAELEETTGREARKLAGQLRYRAKMRKKLEDGFRANHEVMQALGIAQDDGATGG
jgi:hypothetical protein